MELPAKVRSTFIAAAILLGVSHTSAAQAHIRVLADHSVVWRLSSATPLTSVNAGTVLEVIGQDRNWYIVRLPQQQGMPAGLTGRIAISQVQLIDGGPIPQISIQEQLAIESRTIDDNRLGVYGFAQAGFNRWLAHDAFAAVLGSGVGPIVGGGARVLVGDRYGVEVAVERFQKSGQRVFVNNGRAFPLGIRDTVRVIPVYISGIYRQRYGSFTAYGGGGIARYSYRETSDFADPGEDVNDHFNGYQALFGVEFGARTSFVKLAIEAQATNVPDAFGTIGAAAAFDEHNLGGFQIRIKVLAGR